MGWSITVGRIAGTAIRIHITFLMFLVWIAFSASREGGGAAAAANVAFVCALFLCVLLHEFGHILMARRFGVATPDFTTSFLLGLGQISSSGAFSFTNTVSSAQYDNLQYTVSTVPEPGTMLLLGTGLALGARRIRARRARG